MPQSRHIYWPCDDPGLWAGVWLESVGYRDCVAFNVDADPDYLCTHLITKGRIHFQADNGIDVVLEPDDLFSMWPHIGWRLYAAKPYKADEVEMDWVRLKGPMAAEFMRMMGTTETRPWARAASPRKVKVLMRRLQALAVDYPAGADLTAIAVLHELAAACSNYQPQPQRDRPLAQRIREAMEQHIGSGMNVTDYARAFRLSRSRLFLIFKEAFDQSPIQILNDIRLRHAKRLLRETDVPIREVAFSSGYKDPLYFTRQFRKQTGTSPSEFREKTGKG